MAPRRPLTIPASRRSGQVKTCYGAPVDASWRWIYYPLDVIRMFEELSEPDGERLEPGERTPVGQALAAVLFEIDEIATATFSSITLATMLGLLERQQREAAAAPRASGRRGKAGGR